MLKFQGFVCAVVCGFGWLALFPVVAAGQTMVHPGVVVSGTQLAFVREQVKAKREPFYSEYQKAVANEYGTLSYIPKGPPAGGVIECGSHSHPDNGCHAQDDDATAAYLQALLWNLSGDHRYAENAIRILNTYSHGLKSYTNTNQKLQAAWSGELLPRAGELLRYSNSGWKPEDIAAFSKMLTQVILPEIKDGGTENGNWELSMIDAMMGIAVFTDDRALLAHAEKMWEERVPAYFYDFELDGPHPRPAPRATSKTNWFGTTDLNATVDGIAQETCRDLEHTTYSIAATTYAAETAHIQGGKLFEAEQKRLVETLEFHAHLLLKKDPVPALVCGGDVKLSRGYTFAVGYDEFHDRLGVAMPMTAAWLEHVEQQPVQVDRHMMVFELLTHAADAGGVK
jgi:hypothetical protein